MEDILSQLKDLIAQVQAKLVAVSEREQKVADAEAKLQTKHDEAALVHYDLKAREEKVLTGEKLEELRKNLIARESALTLQRDSISSDRSKFEEKANKEQAALDNLRNELKIKEESLQGRELALSREKETYKQTLKDEFYRSVAR